MRVKIIAVAATAAIFLFGCGSDGDDEDASTESSAEVGAEAESPASEEPEATEEAESSEPTEAPEVAETPEETPTPEVKGPAPGVSDEAVKIGFAYVDTDALNAIGLNYNLGDHRAVYEALIADINASGGIAGRQLDAVIVSVAEDHGSVEPEFPSWPRGHELKFCAGEIFFADTVGCVQEFQDGMFDGILRYLALVVLPSRQAAQQDVQTLAGDRFTEGFLVLVPAQMG